MAFSSASISTLPFGWDTTLSDGNLKIATSGPQMTLGDKDSTSHAVSAEPSTPYSTLVRTDSRITMAYSSRLSTIVSETERTKSYGSDLNSTPTITSYWSSEVPDSATIVITSSSWSTDLQSQGSSTPSFSTMGNSGSWESSFGLNTTQNVDTSAHMSSNTMSTAVDSSTQSISTHSSTGGSAQATQNAASTQRHFIGRSNILLPGGMLWLLCG